MTTTTTTTTTTITQQQTTTTTIKGRAGSKETGLETVLCDVTLLVFHLYAFIVNVTKPSESGRMGNTELKFCYLESNIICENNLVSLPRPPESSGAKKEERRHWAA